MPLSALPTSFADMRDAGSLESLTGAIEKARDLLAEHAVGLPAPDASTAWSSFVTTALAAAVRLHGPPDGVDWHWYLTGSCGRGEALPGSDIETLLVFAGEPAQAPEVRARAAQVHHFLEGLGFASDGNGATADRARCCRTIDDWRLATDEWARSPEVDRGVVMIGLASDAAPVSDRSPSLSEIVAESVPKHPQILTAVARDACAIRESVPARLDFLRRNRDVVNVKAAVVDPTVRIARWNALASGSSARSTVERLRCGGTSLEQDDRELLVHALTTGTALRWGLRRSSWTTGRTPDTATLSQLTPLDRTRLRSAGRDVMGVTRILSYLSSFPETGW